MEGKRSDRGRTDEVRREEGFGRKKAGWRKIGNSRIRKEERDENGKAGRGKEEEEEEEERTGGRRWGKGWVGGGGLRRYHFLRIRSSWERIQSASRAAPCWASLSLSIPHTFTCNSSTQ